MGQPGTVIPPWWRDGIGTWYEALWSPPPSPQLVFSLSRVCRLFFPSFLLSFPLSFSSLREALFPSCISRGGSSPSSSIVSAETCVGRVVHTWTFNFALFEWPTPYAFPSLVVPASFATRRTMTPQVCVRSLSLSRDIITILPDTHHRLIPRVFYDRNRYLLMTWSASRPQTLSRFLASCKLSSLVGRVPFVYNVTRFCLCTLLTACIDYAFVLSIKRNHPIRYPENPWYARIIDGKDLRYRINLWIRRDMLTNLQTVPFSRLTGEHAIAK